MINLKTYAIFLAARRLAIKAFCFRMTHTFQPDADGFKQARDANVERADEEYEIFDPRNPMNKRRRLNEAKRAKDRNRPLAGVKDLD